MATKLVMSAKHKEDIGKLGAQLETWATQLDDLVVGYLAVNAQDHDPYRARSDALRARQRAVQARFDAFVAAPGGGPPWEAFRAELKDEWLALQAGFKDLTH